MSDFDHDEQMAWDDPTLYVDPLSLLDSKRHHQWVIRQMHEAGKALKAAKNAETLAKIEYKKAVYKATMHADCPKVKSGGVTVAYRDAWIAEHIQDEHGDLEWDYELARMRHDAARDHVETIKTVAYSMGRLGSIVKQIHDTAGVDR